jgi:hypothetical protein
MGLFRVRFQVQHFANLDPLGARHNDANVATQFGSGMYERFSPHGFNEFGLGLNGAFAGAVFRREGAGPDADHDLGRLEG